MSHVVTVKIEIQDLEAVEAACARLGWHWRPNQKTYAWYGRWLKDYHGNDAAYKNGFDPEQFGKCEHAIGVPKARYEIGLIRQGAAYTLLWDNYATGGLQNLTQENGLQGFLAAYAAEKAKLTAKRQGFKVREQVLDNGNIKLTVEVGA